MKRIINVVSLSIIVFLTGCLVVTDTETSVETDPSDVIDNITENITLEDIEDVVGSVKESELSFYKEVFI